MDDKVPSTSASPAVEQDGHFSVREVVVTIPQRTSALVRGLDLVLMHHGAECLIRGELDAQVHRYLDTCSDETVWLKQAKWLLAYPLSKYLRNEPPPLPSVVFSPTGALRAWMRQRLTVFNRRNTHLWYSWLQVKRCALPASESIVSKTYDDHFASLTRDDPGDPVVIDEIFADPTFKSVLIDIRDEVTKRFQNAPLFEDYSGSNSACFEQTRSNGGQHHELRQLAGLNSIYCDELSRMEWFPVVYGRVRCSNVTWEYRRPEGEYLWGSLRDLAKKFDTTRPINCTIQGILEPMKVRVISKGEALPYYTMKPLQKLLHGVMREMPCFRLIGRPLSPCDIIDLKERAASPWKWFSIDYSAATDGLSWRYSGRILQFLLSCLPQSQIDLAMAVLGPHALHYPNGSKKVFRGVQRNGQLMGSILSFPILCLANLGVYLRVMSDTQRGWSDASRLKHVLVNGDDMVYAGPSELWPVHAKISDKVGLKMSVGKAYVHDEYLNVNSTSVSCKISLPTYPYVDPDAYPSVSPNYHGDVRYTRQEWIKGSVRNSRVCSTPWVIPYLNAGLFFGQHKVQGEHGPSDGNHHEFSGGIVANLNVVLNGA